MENPSNPNFTSPTSYADIVRLDGLSGPKPCNLHDYETRGLEEDPLRSICKYLIEGRIRADNLHESDEEEILRRFASYKAKNPQDAEATKIAEGDIMEIAQFIMATDALFQEFCLELENDPDNEELIAIDESGPFAIVNFMRNRISSLVS